MYFYSNESICGRSPQFPSKKTTKRFEKAGIRSLVIQRERLIWMRKFISMSLFSLGLEDTKGRTALEQIIYMPGSLPFHSLSNCSQIK